MWYVFQIAVALATAWTLIYIRQHDAEAAVHLTGHVIGILTFLAALGATWLIVGAQLLAAKVRQALGWPRATVRAGD